MWPIFLFSAAIGYALGSFPTGFLVGRAHGIDIREHGSRNIGATNVVRVLGKKPGYLVFLCDALKGWLAVRLAGWYAFSAAQTGSERILRDVIHLHPAPHDPAQVAAQQTLAQVDARLAGAVVLAGILGGLFCILGHNFPVWLRFRGGKGVATTVGVMLGLMPAAFGVAAVVWIVVFYASRYVSLASLVAAAMLPVAVWAFTVHAGPAVGNSRALFYFSLVAAALIFWRHRANIQRLLDGTEARFARKPKNAPAVPPNP